MVLQTSPTTARIGRAARLALLVPLADLIGHDAVFEATYGAGQGHGALARSGHGYWPIFAVAVALLAVTIVVASARRIGLLRRRARSLGIDGDGLGAPGYHGELLRCWAALFPLTTLAFLVQENIESVASGSGLAGLAPIDGSVHHDAILILALASLTVALFGALIRWRIVVLERRIAAFATRTAHRRASAERAAPEWGSIAAGCLHRWILVRSDAGRAPPVAI